MLHMQCFKLFTNHFNSNITENTLLDQKALILNSLTVKQIRNGTDNQSLFQLSFLIWLLKVLILSTPDFSVV